MSDEITLDQLKAVVPKNSRRVITEDLVNTLNRLTDEDGEEFASAFRENFLSYKSVLKSGEFKTTDYMRAVKYVSYKLMDMPNIDSYMLTFPDRYEKLMKRWGATLSVAEIRDIHLSQFVTAYNKNKLVNMILEQTLVPTHVLNAPLYQEALNVQAFLMVNARSEMVRSTAATAILANCKPPETSKIELSVGYDQEAQDTQKELVSQIGQIALNQQKMLAAGMSIGEIQKLNIKLTAQTDDDIVDADFADEDE